MRIGLALPQYDYSVPGENPLRWDTVVAFARRAEDLGFDSLWLSDHVFLDLAKYGADARRYGTYEPIAALGALARVVQRPRLGTLVLCEALRPASVLAKAVATLDRLTGGRIDVGLGAGWYEPDYAAVGMAFPRPGERLERLAEAVQVCRGLLTAAGEPFTFEGRHHRCDGAVLDPPPVQQPGPPVIVGGKGDRLLRLAARHADGWNTCWVWTPDAYRERLAVLERACDGVGRDPATVWRSLGLYALCGEDAADLGARFDRLHSATPAGVLDGVTLDDWRTGRLVGTVEQVAEQLATWESLGVETVIVGPGAVPFHVASVDDLDPLAAAAAMAGVTAFIRATSGARR
ncbi:MAG TPA: TIGR03619 family F420-dependent LLM class oxidoreductase [Acidimicrobiia bacterium]|nr:TIGR03619 family F420-dependent LLM class oxidoreductase [Acidimicrobiia bacterium]